VQFIRGCYLESLIRHPVPEATAGLVDLLINQLDLEVRHQAARAIGLGGITREVNDRLMTKLSDSAARNDAALALLLGSDEDTVRRMMSTYNNVDPASIEELKAIYSQTFGYFSDRNYEKGDVARWIRNATAASRIRVRDKLQVWPKLILARALQGIEPDSGPHSVTRVQMRVRLMRDAHGDDSLKRSEAIAILKFMGEKGVLMALRSEAGPWQDPARHALFELMNPAAVAEVLPPKPQAGTVH
jgi:HEAT repeat protein